MKPPSKGNWKRGHRLAAGVIASALALALAFGLAAVPAHALPPNEPAPGAYVTDGPVQAIAHAGGRTYIGGAFTRIGRRSGSGAVLFSAGAPATFPEVAGGDVYASVSDENGGWYIGGSFTTVGGQRHEGLAHINPDGSVDGSFNPSVRDAGGSPAPVYALALSPVREDGDRTLYVGGTFDRIGVVDLQGRTNLAALNASNGSVVLNFTPITKCAPSQEPACQGTVRSFALTHVPVNGAADQPVLFVGGEFTKAGPADALVAASGVVAVWGVGALDGTAKRDGALVMNIPASPTASPAPWAPAFFSQTDSLPLSGGAYAIAPGPVDTPDANTSVLAVYIGGWSNSASPAPIARAFQFKLSRATRALTLPIGSAYSNWKPDPAVVSATCSRCAVRAMSLDHSSLGADLYFAGDFDRVGTPGVAAGHVGKVATISTPNSTTSVEMKGIPFGSGAGGTVRTLVRSGGTLMAAGDFPERILRFDVPSGARSAGWTSPAPDTGVHTLATHSSTSSLYAGGEFRSLGSVVRNGLAAFDSSGGLLGWAPDVAGGSSVPPRVHALAASDSAVYVGGQFDAIPGPGGANLVAVDAASGGLASMPDVELTTGSADVLALSLLGSRLYVGGAFDRVGGQTREHLADIDAGSGAVSGWAPKVEGHLPAVRAIVPACGAVYVGGWFERLAGQNRANLAAADPATGAATGWNPSADGAVLAMARFGSTIYAGGTFSRVGDTTRQRLAALDAFSGGVTGFNASIDALSVGATVRALGTSDTALYVGGRFVDLAGTSRSNLAAVDLASGAALGWDPRVEGRVDALALGGGGVFAGGSFASLGTTSQRGFAAFDSGAGMPFASAACASTVSSEGDDGSGSDTGAPRLAPPPAPSSPPASPPRPTPRVTALSVTPGPVRTSSRALVVRFGLSRSARVRMRFERRVTRRRCRTRSGRRVRRCVRYVRFAAVTKRARRGRNRVTFRRLRVGGRRLLPGRYRLRLVPMPARRGAGRAVYFSVKRRR